MRNLIIGLSLFIVAPLHSQAAYRIYEEGQKLFDAGQYAEAIVKFDATIKADADYFEAYCDRARANMALNKTTTVQADFDKCVALNSKYYQGFYYRAKFEQSSGKNAEAIKDYTSAIALNASLTDAFVQRGILNGNTAAGKADLDAAIKLDPKSSAAYYYRAQYFISAKDQTSAFNDLNSCITNDPLNKDAYYQRAIIESAQKKNDMAIADYSKAITLGKNDTDVYLGRASVYAAAGKNAEAIKDYSTVVEVLHSLNPDNYRKRGEQYLLMANYPYAVKDFTKALQLKKDDVTLLNERGLTYYKMGKTKFLLAEADLKKVIELDPKNATAARTLAQLYFDQSKWQDAVDAITVAIKNAGTGDDYDLRGKCYYQLNNKKSACEDLTKAETMGCKTAASDKMNAGCK